MTTPAKGLPAGTPVRHPARNPARHLARRPGRPAPSRPDGPPARRRPSGVLTRYPALTAIVLGAVFMVLPLLIVVNNALKSPGDYSSHGPLAPPHGLYLHGLTDFWNRVDFGRVLVNSVLISGSVAVIGVVLSVLNAYAIGIGRVRGRAWVLGFFVLANVLPQEALVYPLYYLAKQLGLYDTRFSLVIVFSVIQAAFGTYLLSSVLGAFPREIIEAARIDGAGTWQVLWRIVVPVSRPTLGVLLVFFFIWTWNEFLLPLVMLPSNDNQTVSVALGVLQGQRLMDATMTNAAGLLGALPALAFFLVFQRTLTRGIAVGAVR